VGVLRQKSLVWSKTVIARRNDEAILQLWVKATALRLPACCKQASCLAMTIILTRRPLQLIMKRPSYL